MQSDAVFIKDIFNTTYQVLGPAARRSAPLAAAAQKLFDDETLAGAFIRQHLDASDAFWRRVCGAAEYPKNPRHPGRVPHEVLARMLVAGRIRVYTLPTILSRLVCHNGKGKGYGFLRGPEALPNGLQCIEFVGANQIQSLMDSLKVSEDYWHSVLAGAGLVSQQKGAINYQAEAFQYLNDGSLRAYTFPYTPQTRRVEAVFEDAVVKTAPLAPPSPEEKSSPAPVEIPTSPPQSLEDAEKLLAARREQIKASGYQQKYTDAQLLEKAQTGEVNDRFLVRLIFVNPKNKVEDSPLGFRRGSGRAPYWATTLDMAEAADTDPELLAGLFGIKDFDPNQEFRLAVIDMEKMPPQAERQSFIPTYEKMQAFGEKEFTQKEGFESDTMKKIMNDEFGVEYERLVAGYESTGKSLRSTNDFEKYLSLTVDDERSQELFRARHKSQMEFGANPLFSGLGVTKVTPESRYAKDISQKYGVVETFTFERDPLTIGELSKQGAVKLLPAKIIFG